MSEPGDSTRFLPGRHLLDAYGNGGFRFADLSHRGSLLVLPSGMRAWPPADGAAIRLADIAPILAEAGEIELLLVGMGALPRPLPPAVADTLRGAGLRVEVMPTPAAARTYNVLVGEARRVAAALIAVP